jgi:hypothetical protein
MKLPRLIEKLLIPHSSCCDAENNAMLRYNSNKGEGG